MKKILSITFSIMLIFTLTLASNVQYAEAATKTTSSSLKPNCTQKWPYKSEALAKYNPCLIHTEVDYFAASELSQLSADLGLGGGLASLSQAGYNKLAKELGKRAIGGGPALLGMTAVGVGAELMYRNAKAQGIKGWKVEHKYSYAVQYGINDTLPTKKTISFKYIPVKK